MRESPAVGVSQEIWARQESMGETERMVGAVPRVTRDNRVRPGLLGGTAGWAPLALPVRPGPWWKEKRQETFKKRLKIAVAHLNSVAYIKRFPAPQDLPAETALPA